MLQIQARKTPQKLFLKQKKNTNDYASSAPQRRQRLWPTSRNKDMKKRPTENRLLRAMLACPLLITLYIAVKHKSTTRRVERKSGPRRRRRRSSRCLKCCITLLTFIFRLITCTAPQSKASSLVRTTALSAEGLLRATHRLKQCQHG
jgi:hypothetical protein